MPCRLDGAKPLSESMRGWGGVGVGGGGRYGFCLVKLTQHEINAASAKDIFIAAATNGEPPEDLPNCSNIVTNVCRLHQDFVMWRTNLHQEKYTNSISDTTLT